MATLHWTTYSPNTEPDNHHWVGIVVTLGDRYVRLFEEFEWMASQLTTWRNRR